MKRTLALLLAVPWLVAAGACWSPAASSSGEEPKPAATFAIVRITRTPTPPPTPSPTPTPPATQLCLVTPQRGISATYVPPDLVTLPPEQSVRRVFMRQESAEALLQLLDAARADGLVIKAQSGYRSYADQQQVLADNVRAYGEAEARRQVAEPGHSEHQLGVAIDVTTDRAPFQNDQAFGSEPEGRWLAANAARFGFVISYPPGKEEITGYIYEPWHIRYVGVDLARRVVDSGLTLTEILPRMGRAGCPPD